MNILFSFTFLSLAACGLIIFITLDLAWLTLIARKLYFRQLGYLAEIKNNKITFKLPAGVAAQFIISFSITAFVAISLQLSASLPAAVISGACAGFALYATFDLTNLSFIKKYPMLITVIDIGWGTFQGFCAGFYVYGLSMLLGL